MKQESKEQPNKGGRPKGVKENISFWCNPLNREVIKKFIKDNGL